MKKLSIVLLAVLLIASLIISCDNSTKALTDELVEVRIGTSSGSRGLIANDLTDETGLVWHYSAHKVTESQFKYGETTDTVLPGDGNVTFSQGKWDFGLWALNSAGKKVYSGTVTGVLITKTSDGNPTPVVVPVSPYTGVNGTIKLTEITIHAKTDGETPVLVTPNYAKIDNTEIAGFNGTADAIEVATGSHSVTVAYKGTDGVTYATETIYVTVYSGRETLVQGFVDEETGSADIDHKSKVEIKGFYAVKKETESTEVEVKVTPSMVENKKTVVTFPADSFTNEEAASAVLTVNVKPIDSNFSVGATGNSENVVTVAGLDIALLVNNQPVTQFNSQSVSIVTHIAKGLTGVKVYYKGVEIPGSEYKSDSGELKFSTTHFSEFYVGAAAYSVYNKSQSLVSATLADAISSAKENDEILIVKDMTLDATVDIDKNISLDLNDHTITGNFKRVFNVKCGTLDITGNGLLTISVPEGATDEERKSFKGSSVVRVATGWTVGTDTPLERAAKLIIGENVIVRSDYSYGLTVMGFNNGEVIVNGRVETKDMPAISGNGDRKFYGTVTRILVNGKAFSSEENAIYHPQDGELIINGTVEGKGGIELKSGRLFVNKGASIKSTIIPQTPSRNNNGCSTSGYAIAAVNNDSYKGSVVVNIAEGATVTGTVAIIHDSDILSDGKEKAVIHSQSNSYTTDSNSLWVKLCDDDFFILMEKWDDYKAESYFTPVNTNTKIVTIASAEELALFASEFNNGTNYSGYTVNLTNNIDLGGKLWTPIGNASNQFSGTFDGDNHKISNLTINGTTNYVGLFGYLYGGIVENLIFDNVNITGSEDVGTVVGRIIDNGKVENVHVLSGTVNCTTKRVGGLVGSIKAQGLIIDCSNAAIVSATGNARNAGGIVGSAYYTEVGKEMYIRNCINRGAVTSGYVAAGGIVSLSAANVIGCTNEANIQGKDAGIGGIVGEQKSYGSVTNNINIGNVTNTNSGSYGNGGIIGWLRYHGTNEAEDYKVSNIISVTGNTNSGNVSGGNDAGGIIGTVYNSAVVTGNTNKKTSLSGNTFAAGIVGNYQINETPAAPVPASNTLTFEDNTSLTAIENISASNKDLMIYRNDISTIQ